MRIWDVEPAILCRQHLLGEHRELHGLWNILTKHKGKGGYSRHPETLRWKKKLAALFLRHEAIVQEMKVRGLNHQSDLDVTLATGAADQDVFLHSREEQLQILREKRCDCLIPPRTP